MTQLPEQMVAQVELLIEALNRRDFDTIDGMPWHPEMEFRSMLAAAEGGVYRGVEGLREWGRNVDAIFDGFHNELLEVREVDDERAVVVVRLTATAKASRVPVSQRVAQLGTWRDGKLWRNEVFGNPADAFAAVGLRE